MKRFRWRSWLESAVKNRPRANVVLFVTFGFLPAFLLYLMTFASYERELLERIPPGDYRASLRETHLGCATFLLTRPDILVVGDSHSYAGWDFNLLADGAAGRTVSSCAIAGLYFDTMETLLTVMKEEAYTPRLMIYTTSLRQFMIDPDKEKQMAEHAKLIGRSPARTLVEGWRNLKGFVRGEEEIEKRIKSYTTQAALAATIERHRERIDALDDATVADMIRRSPDHFLMKIWSETIPLWKPDPAAPGKIDAFCDEVRAQGIRLVVVDMPESPLMGEMYSDAMKAAYAADLERLSACAAQFVDGAGGRSPVGMRHYVNRTFDDEYDYGMWSRPGPIEDRAAFDTDHMNPLGAHLFTEWFVSKAGDQLRGDGD